MKLSTLLNSIPYIRIVGDAEAEVTGICTDSRKARGGDLFVCYAGERADSHVYAAEACQKGACAVVCQRELDVPVPQAIVADGRAAVAPLARAFYGYADKKLKIVAVTGTNGKTTTTYMLRSIFAENGNKTGIIGTLGIFYGDTFIAPELTTPDPVFLHGVFADMAACGVEYVFMEVSAHALYFGKTAGLNFDAAIFTNLTRDHLDFFKDMQSYARAKCRLFEDGVCKVAVVNSDDELGAQLARRRGVLSYGLNNPADTFAIDVVERIDGSDFVINLCDELYDIRLNMPAVCNVYNALAAATCAHALGVDISVIARGLAGLRGVPGRLERVAEHNGGLIFVDYAHTPDGIEKVLGGLKRLCTGKLYCLFGCGGNRDSEKRPLMGECAAKYADFLIVTSDNPRFEDAYDIISMIEPGIQKAGKPYVTISDREMATEYAIDLLDKGDILLVAGKGGENYQDIMGIKHSYNDNTIIKKILGERS